MKLRAINKAPVILSTAKDLRLRFFSRRWRDQNDVQPGFFSKVFISLLLSCTLASSTAFSLTPVEDSAEDIYWVEPMTVHSYKRNTDLHSITASAMALTELEFVELGDGLINFTLRSNKSPISRSLDSVEYAYSKLPQVLPVRRFGQFWDALQLRQLALSDARIVTSVLFFDSYGGVTPVMQVRAYKLVVFVEDVIYDIDSLVMLPFNWGLSSIRDKPTKIKGLGYVADGLGVLRWHVSEGLKYVSKKVVKLGSNVVLEIEEVHDALIRRKKKKESGHLVIYSRMPFAVFQENRSYFENDEGAVTLGTLADWHEQIFYNPELLPEDIQAIDLRPEKITPSQDPFREVIVAAEYRLWEKTSSELKKYVITSDEFKELVQNYDPLSFSGPALVENT